MLFAKRFGLNEGNPITTAMAINKLIYEGAETIKYQNRDNNMEGGYKVGPFVVKASKEQALRDESLSHSNDLEKERIIQKALNVFLRINPAQQQKSSCSMSI